MDTVGDEKQLYRKSHFGEMREGFRKLQYQGFRIKSHHGETWNILRTGVQSVDNAMNIWHIDTLEHGISLELTPIFISIEYINTYRSLIKKRSYSKKNSLYFRELQDMNWDNEKIREKILQGEPLNLEERKSFKTKISYRQRN